MIKFKYVYLGTDYYANFNEIDGEWEDRSIPAFILLDIAAKRSLTLLHDELYVISPEIYFVEELKEALSFVGISITCLNPPMVNIQSDHIY